MVKKVMKILRKQYLVFPIPTHIGICRLQQYNNYECTILNNILKNILTYKKTFKIHAVKNFWQTGLKAFPNMQEEKDMHLYLPTETIENENFNVSSFELTMHSLYNERGNELSADAFEVYVQHYVTVSGTGNAPYWTSDSWFGGTYMFKPRGGQAGEDGTYPDALIPQEAAISKGEATIAAGNNKGIWVNLNVEDAAPGSYTGFATLTVNGNDMAIPVSVRIYDVTLPDEVHMQSSFQIWWDHLQQMEGYYPVDDSNFNEFKNLAQEYFDYLVSKRIMPYDNWGKTRFDSVFPDYAAEYLAVAPEISSYGLYHNYLDFAGVKNTLTALIQKNISFSIQNNTTINTIVD